MHHNYTSVSLRILWLKIVAMKMGEQNSNSPCVANNEDIFPSNHGYGFYNSLCVFLKTLKINIFDRFVFLEKSDFLKFNYKKNKELFFILQTYYYLITTGFCK